MELDRGFWRVHCHVGQHPGQWQRWFREQCCAVGWHPNVWQEARGEGWTLSAPGADRDFVTTVNHLRRMREGDWIVATLPGHKIGRLGRIFRLEVEDEQWNPVIPPTRKFPFGENGRRILVRWQLDVGPADLTKVVQLPPKVRLNAGQLRGTARRIPLDRLGAIMDAMREGANWVSLHSAFNLETALSSYIALHPHVLEDGLTSHPGFDATEQTFADGRRADVILEDAKGRTLVVECKQGAPTLAACDQVHHYRSELQKLLPENVACRAMLVYGGSRHVAPDVRAYAQRDGIELVNFALQVNFSGT